MATCLRLGTRVEVDPWWPQGSEYDSHWFGYVKEFKMFHGTELVLVQAEERSDDPMVENELWFPFGALQSQS